MTVKASQGKSSRQAGDSVGRMWEALGSSSIAERVEKPGSPMWLLQGQATPQFCGFSFFLI